MTDGFLIALSILVLGLGLALIGWMLRPILLQVRLNTRGWSEGVRFRHREKVLRSADEALRKHVSPGSLRLLKEAFFFDYIKSDGSLVDKVTAHNQSIIGRLLGIADSQSKQISHLAVLEDLLDVRRELLRSYHEAINSRRSLGRNRKKPVPSWALEEYSRKVRDLDDRLKTNKRSLESQLSELFVVLLREEQPEQITYH